MLIIGAGNLGKHAVDQLMQDNYTKDIIFFDENMSENFIYNRFPVIHDWKSLNEILVSNNNEFFIAIGNPRIRQKMLNKIQFGKYQSLISTKTSVVSSFAKIGAGSLVQPACCISHNVIVGKSCLLHANTLVGHDVIINDFVTIGSNVNILKGVKIDNYSIISPNVLIYPNIKIGNNVFVEPGAIIKTDIEDFQTVNT
ncbi:MAG: hypothetical protein PHW82_09020 [Bacteroidales bacterium]|nr:hypothetical protein [Bacteroidales bacterium]MDY0140899.1 hypothetical protein [Bacteroidales bacterium]